MSTVKQPRPKAAPFADRDPQVYHPLDRLRGVIRRYVVIEGILSAVLFVALWFTAGLILDYGLFKVTGWDWAQDGAWWVRALALAAALLLFIAILVFRIVRRLTTEFSYASLALVLERRYPKLLGDRLITAVEMADVEAMGKFGYSKDMLRATIAEARERVAKVPVHEVFNWRRLWLLGFLAIGLLITTVSVSYGAYAIAAPSASPYRFSWKFAHVTSIFFERNVALMNTPWPRRAHIELVDFPESGELTVGRDAPPPRITARAYRWVIADNTDRTGWRPLRWSDLTSEFVGRSVPALPEILLISPSGGKKDPSMDAVERVAYETDEEVTPEIAKARAILKEFMNNRVEPDPDNPGHTRTVTTQDFEELQEVIKALLAKADQPSMGRTLRRLDIPGEVTYKYSGKKTAGNGTLAPQQNNEFAGEMGGLKEDVEFVVRGADFLTLPKKIRLIPPPSLKRLGREQAEPAYLHHAPPLNEGYNALKGRLQKIAAKDLSIAGERTVFAVPAGTELTLNAEVYTADDGTISDNDRLVSAYAIPVTGRFPGTVYENGKPTQKPVPLALIGDGEGFRVDFKNAPPDPKDLNKLTDFRLVDNVEFKVVYTNKYNVSATRSFLVQVVQDQAPVVEVAVDVIRKVGNVYLVTPKARIPFNPDSFVKDDHGLSKVEYVFNYWAEDSDVVRSIRTKYALRSLLDIPLPGTTPTALFPRLHADNFRLLDKSDDRLTASVFVSDYVNQASLLRRDTREQFEALLASVKSEDTSAQTVTKIELKDPNRDYFDLKELHDRGIISLMPKGDDVQTIYRMDLNVQATDNNVDAEGGPRVTRNSEPIRLRIVSEGDLLLEIGREEEQLAQRLEEALTKIAGAKKKYEFVRTTNGYKEEEPAQVDAVKVRAQDALGDVEKSRDIVQTVAREYRRLFRECEINRLNEAALKRYREFTELLDGILSERPDIPITFPKTQALLNAVQTPLNVGKWAPLALVTDAEMSIYRLEDRLKYILDLCGQSRSIEKLKQEVYAIKEKQIRIGQEIDRWRLDDESGKKRPFPTFGGVGVLSFAKGEAKPVQQTIAWNQYPEDEIVVKFAVFDANNQLVPEALTVPKEMKLSFEQHQFRFDYEVKAGNKEGTFKVRLTPAVGPPVEYQVIVK